FHVSGVQTCALPISNLRSNNWYSTQTTAFSLLAISEFLGKNKVGQNIQATVTINGKSQEINSNQFFVNVDLPENAGNYSVQENSGNVLFCDLVRSGVSMNENLPAESSNLKMKVNYLDMNNQIIDPRKLTQGTDFKCVVTISNPGMLGDYSDLALTQMFPSGWEIINTRVNNQVTSTKNFGIDYQDFRDDRVYSYFDLSAAREISVTILLNATYKGIYYLPAVYCEAMYDHSVYA